MAGSRSRISALHGRHVSFPPASFVREDGVLHVRMPAPAASARLRYIGDRTFVADTEPDVLQFRFEYQPEGRRVRMRMAGMLWYGDD